MVEAERARWPATIEVGYLQDKSNDIRNMLNDLGNNVLASVALTMIITVAMLGLRSSLLVGLAVPVSFLCAMAVLGTMGLTVNIIVLFSLILAVGMLVDGATVVVEYADRKMAEGMTPKAAYQNAAVRMFWPVTASTATVLAAFLPLLFWPGIVGEFMRYLPITLVATLVASLVMAMIFVPVLGGMFGRAGYQDAAAKRSLAATESGDLADVRGWIGAYVRLLAVLIRWPVLVTLAGVAPRRRQLVGLRHVRPRRRVLPRGRARAGPGPGPRARRQVGHGARPAGARGRAPHPGRARAQARLRAHGAGMARRRGHRRGRGRPDPARVHRLEDAGHRPGDHGRDPPPHRRSRRHPGRDPRAQCRPAGRQAGPARDRGAGPEQARRRSCGQVRGFFDRLPGLKDVADSRPVPGIEWQLAVDREAAARYGADIATVGSTVRLVTNGLKVATYRPDDADDEVDIVARYPLAARHLGEIDRLVVNTPRGAVPLGHMVERTAQPRTGDLIRVDSSRTYTISADVEDGVLADTKVGEVRAWLAAQPFDPEIRFTFRGEDEEQAAAQAFLGRAFGVALFLIAMILLLQFNSFYEVFLILSAIVFSTVGVFLGLLIVDQPFGIIMSGIGVIALAGIVVSNNIVLIDTYNELRGRGLEPVEAVLRTCAQRIRPVLLTAFNGVLGLLPLVFKMNVDLIDRAVTVGGPSADWWQQLSLAIAWGLTFATVITLVLTPCLLILGARAGAAWQRAGARWRAWRRRDRRRLGGAEVPQAAE